MDPSFRHLYKGLIFLRLFLRKFFSNSSIFINYGLCFFIFVQSSSANEIKSKYFKLAPRNINQSNWVGNKILPESLLILILAGHADSQGIEG